MSYKNQIAETSKLIAAQNGTWDSISPESVARMQLQNRFQTGLDIARYTADIMRQDMANTPSRSAAGTVSSPSRR